MNHSVLVVDDSAMSRKLIRRALPAGFAAEVHEAAGGQAAIDRVREGGIDLMILDLTMPDMDGFQVLETLNQEGLSCPVVVASADIQAKARERTRELGALGFIEKPIKAENVETVLKECGLV